MGLSNSLDTINQQSAWLGLHQRVPVPTFKLPQLAKVQSSTASTVDVILQVDGWESTVFRAVPYQVQRGPVPATPAAGTQCVVGFVGNGLDKPYVLMFVGWPASWAACESGCDL